MGINGRIVIIGALLLGGCIPPSAPPPSSSLPPVAEAPPHLDPQFDAVTDEKPLWEMRPVSANAVTIDGQRYHQVSAGETGIAIARAYGVPWRDLVAANGLTEPFVIKAGQKLLLPASATPSMEARARAFRLDIDDILTGGEPAQPRRPTSLPAIAEPARFAGRFDWPIPGRVVTRFGPAGPGRVNQGIDIAAPSGGAIRAAADGVVAFVGDGVPGYGGLILVRHGDGWISAYGYAARADVKRGDNVRRGDPIGVVSAEAGPALHFELRKNRKPVDPVAWLPRR
jgi:murein DD-endopeptidase MepM/ murein hydrolase activator NlpD